MLLSRLLAGFTRGESDTLRKAMGKKLIDKMNHLKGKFMEGGQERGHKPEVLEKIWKDWEKFASYAFNKSHATCYSWVAFQTAYLKANYPAEYMAAVLSRNKNDNNKLSAFMDECSAMRISVKGPDVNESFANFGVNSAGDIRFGLAAIKGIGEGVVKAIIDERTANGPFKSIHDFIERVDLTSGMTRRIIENLAQAGAFDCFASEIQREDFFLVNNRDEPFSEQLVRYGQLYQRDRQQQSASLFDDFADGAMSTAGRPPIRHAAPWVAAERLSRERELVGRYLSAHPLDPYYMELTYGTTSIKNFSAEDYQIEEGMEITLGGMVSDFQVKQGQKGPFGILRLEDLSGSTELRLFGRTFADFNGYCTPGQFIRIIGKYQRRYGGEDLRFNIVNISLLEDIKGRVVRGVALKLNTRSLSDTFTKLFTAHASSSTKDLGELQVNVFDPHMRRSVTLHSPKRIPINKNLIKLLTDEGIDFSIIKNSNH